MHLLGGEMKARLQAFDSIVEKNAQALANPQVAQVLGAYTATLSSINQQLFLPNVRGSSIRLPKGHQQDNYAALLPLLQEDVSRGLNYTLSMLLPGEDQLDRTAKRIAAGPLDCSEADAYQSVVRATMALRTESAQLTLDGQLKEVAKTRAQGLFPSSGTIGNYVLMLDEKDILYSRQMIVAPSDLAEYSVPAVASIGLQEELHVEDHNTMRFEDHADTAFRYRKALRGFHIGALVLECMDDEIQDSDQLVIHTTLYVEALRQRTKEGTNESPFSPNDAIIAHFAAYDSGLS